jgi:hypothetical protein
MVCFIFLFFLIQHFGMRLVDCFKVFFPVKEDVVAQSGLVPLALSGLTTVPLLN